MTTTELSAISKSIGPVIREFVARAIGEFTGRLQSIEDRIASVKDGKDAPAPDFDAIAARAAALIPTPKDGLNGKDADTALIDELRTTISMLESEIASIKADMPVDVGPDMVAIQASIDASVAKAFAALPTPKDGKDGKDGEINMLAVAALVTDSVETAVAALPKPKDGLDGRDGNDADPIDPNVLAALVTDRVDSALSLAVATLPKPKDGLDGRDGKDAEPLDLAAIDATVTARVDGLLATWPKPKNGESVSVDDVLPFIHDEVLKAVAQIPAPKDGVGVAAAVIDRHGELVVTLSDGTMRTLGPVVGKDGERGAPGLDGKNGLDGVGFDDFDAEFDDDGHMFLCFVRGENVKRFRLQIPAYRGVYRPENQYLKGDCVTSGGSTWIAKDDTQDRPGASPVWLLSVKEGQRGKPGKDGKDGINGKDFVPKKDGPQW